MKKHIRIFQYCCCGVIFFLVCSAFIPLCGARTYMTQSTDGEKTLQELTVKNTKTSDTDDEDFFDFAIIWGRFEIRDFGFPFLEFRVLNPAPWYNRTINVLGYQSFVHQWFFKKSWDVECLFVHIGIVGFHRLAVVAYGNIAAF